MATAINPTTITTIAPTRTSAKPGEYHAATIAGTLVLTAAYPEILKIDPGVAARDVVLDTPVSAMRRRIINAATGAVNLVVKNAAAATIGTINQNEQGEFWFDGSAWTLIAISAIALA